MNYIVLQSTHLMDKYLLNEITVKGTIFWPSYISTQDNWIMLILI
jgi:hypothetical protein